MTRLFNDELLKYSGDQELLTKLNGLWEKNRDSGGPFLHEVPPKYLKPIIGMIEGLLNGMTLVPTKEWADYRKLSTDTTRRLGHALGLLQDLVDKNRGFSRSAIRGWIATLSAPLEDRTTEEVKYELDNTMDLEGDDWLKHGREYFEEFKQHVLCSNTPLNELPQQVAIGRIEQGLQALGPMFNMMLLFMEQLDGERKEMGKALQDFNKDMEKINADAAAQKTLSAQELREKRELNQMLWDQEVQSKLENLGNARNKIGDMNRSEILALSAGLDVALRARDNDRR